MHSGVIFLCKNLNKNNENTWYITVYRDIINLSSQGRDKMLDNIEKIVNIIFTVISTIALVKALKKDNKDDKE